VPITIEIRKPGYDVITTTHEFKDPSCKETWVFTDTHTDNWGDYITLNCYAEVSGFVWNDVNGNTLYDFGEPLLPGTTCTLYTDNKGKILKTKLTNEYGICRFDVGEDVFPLGKADFTWGDDLEIGVGAKIEPIYDIKPCSVRVVNLPL
jgi:hypothetical protein